MGHGVRGVAGREAWVATSSGRVEGPALAMGEGGAQRWVPPKNPLPARGEGGAQRWEGVLGAGARSEVAFA